jgi:hypothetical protein
MIAVQAQSIIVITHNASNYLTVVNCPPVYNLGLALMNSKLLILLIVLLAVFLIQVWTGRKPRR